MDSFHSRRVSPPHIRTKEIDCAALTVKDIEAQREHNLDSIFHTTSEYASLDMAVKVELVTRLHPRPAAPEPRAPEDAEFLLQLDPPIEPGAWTRSGIPIYIYIYIYIYRYDI